MREYDNETLTKVQKAELGILRDFVDLCEKNNLTYFLSEERIVLTD